MPRALVRLQKEGHTHFITFSCYDRRPYLADSTTRDVFESALESMRNRYDFLVFGYVIMPEHVHLLLSEPARAVLARALQALKLSVAKKRSERPFWQTRYYDFNVFTNYKHIEKLHYIHFNPVRRGLVAKPEDWRWSSFLHHATGEVGRIEIESEWTATRAVVPKPKPTSQNRDVGHPTSEHSPTLGAPGLASETWVNGRRPNPAA